MTSSLPSSFSLIARSFRRCRKARRKEKDAGTTEDPKLYLEEAALERQLPELDLRMLVDLPPGLDYNEWLASHTLALFDHINLVYGTISEFCTMTGCPDMTGPGFRYALPLPLLEYIAWYIASARTLVSSSVFEVVQPTHER